MAVIDDLAGGKDSRRELHAVDDRVQPPFQELDQVLAGVAAAAVRLGINAAELPLGDVPVIALKLLLGRKLNAVPGRLAPRLAVLPGAERGVGDVPGMGLKVLVGGKVNAGRGRLAPALAVLAGAVFAFVDRTLGPTPQIHAETAVDLVLRLGALAHFGPDTRSG